MTRTQPRAEPPSLRPRGWPSRSRNNPCAPGPSWPSLCPLFSPSTMWDRTPGIDRELPAERSRQAQSKTRSILLAPRLTLTGPKPRMKPAAPGAAAAVAAGTEHPKWRLPRPHHRYCRRRDLRGNLNTLRDLGRLSLPRGSQEKVSQSQFPRSRKRESLMTTLRGSVWEPPELTGVSDCRVPVGSGCGGWAQSYSRDPAPGGVVRFPTRGGAGGDWRGASPLPSGVLLGVALRLGALTPSFRAGGGARLTPSPGARLGGRWVWGGSGAGDGGGRYCGGSGTSGRSPGSAVRWAEGAKEASPKPRIASHRPGPESCFRFLRPCGCVLAARGVRVLGAGRGPQTRKQRLRGLALTPLLERSTRLLSKRRIPNFGPYHFGGSDWGIKGSLSPVCSKLLALSEFESGAGFNLLILGCAGSSGSSPEWSSFPVSSVRATGCVLPWRNPH
ncbi:unnamed protein product [Rangifer tarandus platyrhynchus]|uniref:Uncharacterized protein n=2 Tax=Rangifer tarandus platyrhynchus TaxID=3082113 RepID=A0ABN8YQ41_RANTA|nr:unnamed protein product [Rangifer tarandus platyrhynchus]CAI9697195.1 unnamed protein product [Rangifer tarandus platyrhynchus]